jgi:hypothetical protein
MRKAIAADSGPIETHLSLTARTRANPVQCLVEEKPRLFGHALWQDILSGRKLEGPPTLWTALRALKHTKPLTTT